MRLGWGFDNIIPLAWHDGGAWLLQGHPRDKDQGDSEGASEDIKGHNFPTGELEWYC